MARALTRWNLPALLLAALLGCIAAAAAYKQIQLAITAAMLVFVLGLRLRSRAGAILTMWLLWLLVPMLRRVIELWYPAPAADPLVLLPIMATFLLAVMEIRENRLNQRARSVMVFASVGILIGVPVGLTVDPAAAIFASLAYVSGVSAVVIGWGDQVRGPENTVLTRLLTYGLVPIALYAIAQYFFPFTPWDAQWVKIVSASGLGSIEAPQEGKIRVFGTLNAPFTFAMVLTIGMFFAIALRRRAGVKILIILPLVVALSLTYVRSAWLALVVGLIVYAFAGSDRSAGRTVVTIFVCLAAVVVVGGSNPTTKAFTDRITSLGSPSSDISAQDRYSTSLRLIPASIGKPLGTGMGQAGLAANLNTTKGSAVVDIDNGYLAILYQSGPVGLLLVLIAFVSCVRAATEALRRAPPGERTYRAIILSILVMMLVAQSSGDVLFGITGVIFWYLGGLSIAAAREPARELEPVPINALPPPVSPIGA